MLKPGLIESLPELRAPVLTIYLDTNREKTANRALEPGYLINLGSQARLAEERLYPEDRGLFREQVERAEAYLRTHRPRSKGVIIFAERGQSQIAIVDGAERSKTFSNSASNLLQCCMLHFCCSLRARRASR